MVFDGGEDSVDLGEKGVSFKEIVMRQFDKVSGLLSVELRGGFYSSVRDKEGKAREVYVVDSREVFCNGVLALAILLLPKFDKVMERFYSGFCRDLEVLRADFLKGCSVKQGIILGDVFYKSVDDRVLLEKFKEDKLRLFVGLFSEISRLLGRKRWLEMGGDVFE